MKSLIKVLLVGGLAAYVSTVEAATGSSAWFFVDTTDGSLKISDVTSKYFDGKYGGSAGRKSTFLNGTPCEIEMKVLMDDYSEVDYWLVNGREVTARTFTVDVGTLPVGGKLEVVAVGKEDGVRSEPFRVNFDIAEHVDEEHKELWTARTSNSGGIDEIRYTLIGAGTMSFPLALEKNITKPDWLRWVPGDNWSICPKVELKPEVRSSGNGSCKLATIGGTAKNKFGKVMNKDVTFTFSGGPLTLSWNAQKKKWVTGPVSFGLKVGGSIGCTYPYLTPIGPVFVEWKGEIALAGSVKVSGIDSALSGTGWSGLESAFTFSSDSLPKFSGGGGWGINKLACLKGVISGMSVFNVTYSKGSWSDFRWGLKGSGALTYVFLGFNGNLIELTSDTYWLINNSLPKAARLMSGVPSDGIEWKLQSRDYLESAKTGIRLMSVPVGEGVAVVEFGGYPDSAPAMASGIGGDALAYLRDNASRSSANRTELVLRTGTSNEWSAAEAVWDDGTADFMPSLAAMPDGSIAAAWMNTSRTFSDDVMIDEFCGAEEIAVGIRNAATGVWTCRNLTADGAFDFSPAVRTAANGKILVAWLRNASGKMTSSSAEPTDIMAAIYANGAWNGATTVLGSVGIVNGFDVAFDGKSAVLAFSKDADGDPSTADDAEMYALRLNGGVWDEPVRLTSAGDADGTPLVRADGGSFAVLWTAKGALMETTELAPSNAVAVVAADGWTLPAHPVMMRGAGGRDALVWNGMSADGGAADAPMAMMYDPLCGAWGAPVKLFDNGRKENRLSGAVGVDGGIRIGYESSSVATNAEGEAVLGDVELRTRFIPATSDLAVMEDGFSFSTNVFVDGESVDLTVKAANLGFRPATNATVRVYEGAGDEKSELASIVTNFPGGGIVAVSVPWTVDTTQTNLQFTVEVDAGENEEDEDNNVFVWSAGAYDVAFGGVLVRNENATRRLLTANVANRGLGPLAAGGKVVFRRGGEDGEVLGEDTLGAVWPGADGVYGAGFAWDMSGAAFTSAWETVCVQLFPEGTAGEKADTAFVQVMTPLGTTNVTVNVGGGKYVTVPGAWLLTYEDIVRNSGGDVATALQSMAANGRLSNVECYILGLDPGATNDFRIVSFPMKADGSPDLAGLAIDPPLVRWNVPGARAVLKGAATLEGPWVEVGDGEGAAATQGGGLGEAALPLRFFKVEVVLP